MSDASPAAAVLAAGKTDGAGAHSLPLRLCAACVQALPVDAAALSLVGKGIRQEGVGVSDAAAARAEEIQATVGEGPTIEALASGRPVLVADIDGVEGRRRWPGLAQATGDLEMRGLFSFPLQLGAIGLGALTLYRRTPGGLSPDALADALKVADVIALLLVGRHGDLIDDFDERWLEESAWARQVHQATGMLIAQLGVDAEEALVRLRAHAFVNSLSLGQVAAAVVARRLRLDAEDQ